MAPSRDSLGSGTEPAAATAEDFMLIPLVKPSAFRAAVPDREAAGSPGFCFPQPLQVLRGIHRELRDDFPELEGQEGTLKKGMDATKGREDHWSSPELLSRKFHSPL
jgi:hypothetical protein